MAQSETAYCRWPTSLLIFTLTDPETPAKERAKIRVIIDQRIPIPEPKTETPPLAFPMDVRRLDWLSADWQRLLDVFGHLNNNGNCAGVRSAIDQIAKLQGIDLHAPKTETPPFEDSGVSSQLPK
jgi:hypothetical protein